MTATIPGAGGIAAVARHEKMLHERPASPERGAFACC
jgi:hypothetical protein